MLFGRRLSLFYLVSKLDIKSHLYILCIKDPKILELERESHSPLKITERVQETP